MTPGQIGWHRTLAEEKAYRQALHWMLNLPAKEAEERIREEITKREEAKNRYKSQQRT